MIERIVSLEKKLNEAVEVITDLVALKNEKDANGKTPHYLKYQPFAWEDAREFLANFKDDKK